MGRKGERIILVFLSVAGTSLIRKATISVWEKLEKINWKTMQKGKG